MYQNNIFDLYGTLVDINTDEGNEELWKKMSMFYAMQGANYTPAELKEQYELLCEKAKKEVIEKTKVEHPDIIIEDVFLKLYKAKNVEASLELAQMTSQMFRVTSTEYIKLYDGVIDLLESLKAKQKKVYLLSNAQYIFTYYEMLELGIIPYFDGIVISSEELCCKPERKFYDTVIERYQLDKAQSIMIGNDLITDIKGSKEAGLDSLYIKSNISPDHEIENLATYSVEDGDVYKIKELILK